MSPDFKRDLESKITAYPLAAVAIALAAGALVGLGARRSKSAPPSKRTVSSLLLAGVSAIVTSMVRSAVLEQLSGAAKSWLGPEDAASRDRSVESFLEH